MEIFSGLCTLLHRNPWPDCISCADCGEKNIMELDTRIAPYLTKLMIRFLNNDTLLSAYIDVLVTESYDGNCKPSCNCRTYISVRTQSGCQRVHCQGCSEVDEPICNYFQEVRSLLMCSKIHEEIPSLLASLV